MTYTGIALACIHHAHCHGAQRHVGKAQWEVGSLRPAHNHGHGSPPQPEPWNCQLPRVLLRLLQVVGWITGVALWRRALTAPVDAVGMDTARGTTLSLFSPPHCSRFDLQKLKMNAWVRGKGPPRTSHQLPAAPFPNLPCQLFPRWLKAASLSSTSYTFGLPLSDSNGSKYQCSETLRKKDCRIIQVSRR